MKESKASTEWLALGERFDKQYSTLIQKTREALAIEVAAITPTRGINLPSSVFFGIELFSQIVMLVFNRQCSICGDGDGDIDLQDLHYKSVFLEANHSWEITKGVYHFEAEAFDNIWHSKLQGPIPPSIVNLPEYAIMLDFPSPQFYGGEGWIGAVAKITYSIDTQMIGLLICLIPNNQNRTDNLTWDFGLMGGDKLIQSESIEKFVDEVLGGGLEGRSPEDTEFLHQHRDDIDNMVRGVVNCLLHLSSDKPNPKLPNRRIKRGQKFIKPAPTPVFHQMDQGDDSATH